jgi:hypothetical protein
LGKLEGVEAKPHPDVEGAVVLAAVEAPFPQLFGAEELNWVAGHLGVDLVFGLQLPPSAGAVGYCVPTFSLGIQGKALGSGQLLHGLHRLPLIPVVALRLRQAYPPHHLGMGEVARPHSAEAAVAPGGAPAQGSRLQQASRDAVIAGQVQGRR